MVSRVLCVGLSCCALVACNEANQYRVAVQFESQVLASEVAWARVELADGCDLEQDRKTGEILDEFEAPRPLGTLPEGEHFVRGWAYNAACDLAAAGCARFDAVAGANVTVTLTLTETNGAVDCSQCDPATCNEDDDGGEACDPFEVICDDNEDGDCDGLVDCMDPDCVDQTCDDGNGCTDGDTCVDFQCVGEGLQCDDQNPCTDNVCSDGVCSFVNNQAACDDGFWCNGSDQCGEGTCSVHSDPPCGEFCNENLETCAQCASDADCGAPEEGEWTECLFGNVCTTSGMRTREVKTPTCDAGRCTISVVTEKGACSRASTNGTKCGSTRYGKWSGCQYSGACDSSGQQTRDVFTKACGGGSCQETKSTEKKSCSRTVSNGKSCGGTWMRCCDGQCRDLKTNAFCGSCAVDCRDQGRACVGSGSGGYHCNCSNSDAQCRALYNSAATCYENRCNCQCGSAGVCKNGGCGANFWCHDCPGQNFCAPFGGGC